MKLTTASLLTIISCSLILFSCSSKSPVNQADLEKIVDAYCTDVAEGNYAIAYEKYFNSAYKKDISLKDFTTAHEKRKVSHGILLEKKVTRMIKTSNIFTGLREYQFTYELKYYSITVHEIIKLNDADGKFLIEGTYTSSSSKTLRFMVW